MLLLAQQIPGPVQYRSTGTPAPAAISPPPVQTRAGTSPPPPPGPPPPPVQQRSIADLESTLARLVAEAEALQARISELTPEEVERLDAAVAEAETTSGELESARRAERLRATQTVLRQPTRPAPVVHPQHRSAPSVHAGNGNDQFEALRTWLRSFTDDPDRSGDASHRAASAGFNVGSTAVRLPCDYGGSLNRIKRRSLSKGGTNLGAELIPKTYSAKVTEYITYFSPILSLVDSETTADGNSRDYFRIDDTALMSSYITASSGTELNPTIPDKDIATGAVTINAFDITSGYHKLTRQVVRDSAVMLVDKVSKAIGNSHARRMEYDLVNGTGNGTTGIQGLVAASTVYGSAVDTFTPELFEAVYFSVPQQYRGGCVWLMSDTAMAKAVANLKDTAGNSLFGKTAEDEAEIRTLHGRPVYTSEHMPAYGANAKSVLFFNPMFYMLRLVEGQTIDVLREKFYPHIAYAGGMAFGGAWLGPASAAKCIQLDADPDSE